MVHIRGSILGILLCLGSCLVLEAASCPYEDKNCVCSGRKVVCTNLDTVPLLTSDDGSVDTLVFSNGTINSISGNSLPSNLVNITFDNLPITDISDDAFNSSSTTLTQVTFISLRLQQVPTALLATNNLTNLTVWNTQTYDSYNSTLMQHLGKSLRFLTLFSNSLSIWPVWLQSFSRLEQLNLNGNLLIHGQQISLWSVAGTLKSINLERTLLTAINNSFSGLSLTDLVLSVNSLGRNMNDLDNSLLPIAKTLRNLYLNNNLLHFIPSTISSMDKLILLDLSQNYLTTIPLNSFPPNLMELNLSENDILQITDTSFPKKSQLQSLNLNKNQINVTSPLAFQPLQQLISLLLNDNNLIKIPASLTSLTHIQTLDLSFNFHMACNCPRGQLVDWYRSLPQLTVTGLCTGYDESSSYDINLYFQMKGYKVICSGFTSLVYSWCLCLVMICVSMFILYFD